mgnify:CR=1 FL=1
MSSSSSTINRDEENKLEETLGSLFQKILDINEELNHSSMSTNDSKYQASFLFSFFWVNIH